MGGNSIEIVGRFAICTNSSYGRHPRVFILDLHKVLDGAPSLQDALEEGEHSYKDFVIAEAALPVPEDYYCFSASISLCEPTWKNEHDISIYVVTDGHGEYDSRRDHLHIAYVFQFGHTHGVPHLTFSASSGIFQSAKAWFPPSTSISRSGQAILISRPDDIDGVIMQYSAFSIPRVTQRNGPIRVPIWCNGDADGFVTTMERYSGAFVHSSRDDSSVRISYFD